MLGYSELFQRVVPIELRSFPSSTLLQRLFTSSSCPSGLKELYSDLSNSAEGTSKSTLSGCSSPMSTTNSSAGVEMMKVRVLSHVVGGITTSVRVSAVIHLHSIHMARLLLLSKQCTCTDLICAPNYTAACIYCQHVRGFQVSMPQTDVQRRNTGCRGSE